MREPVFLEGGKVHLRPVLPADLENGDYLAAMNDQRGDAFTEHALFPHTPLSLREYAEMRWRDRDSMWLAIVDGENGAHVGNIELRNLDWIHGTAELMIFVFPSHQDMGYGTQAMALLLRHAFQRINLHRVWLRLNAENEPARKLYLRAGMKEEGREREAINMGGRRVDAIVMGVLASEFDG